MTAGLTGGPGSVQPVTGTVSDRAIGTVSDRAIGTVSDRAIGILIAWAALDGALAFYLYGNGTSIATSTALLASVVLVALALLGTGQPASVRRFERVVVAILVLQTALFCLLPYRQIGDTPPITIQFIAAGALIAVLVGVAIRRWEVGIAIAIVTAVIVRFVIVAGDIAPTFDVPYIQAAAGQALVDGTNPYLTHVYIEGYPYWPLAAVAAAVGSLVGDARWANVVADVVIAASLVIVARSSGLGIRVGLAMAALWLWSLAGLFMTWQGFPEPILIAFFALAVVSLVRARPWPVLAGICIGLAIATKQFGLGLVAFLPLSGPALRWRTLPAALIVAGACILPFLLWGPEVFIHGSIVSLLEAPGRPYSLNLLEPLPGLVPRLHVPFAAAAVLGLILGALVRWRWQASVAGWVASSAMFFLTVFLLNAIGFVNYYQLVLGLLVFLALLPDTDGPASTTDV